MTLHVSPQLQAKLNLDLNARIEWLKREMTQHWVDEEQKWKFITGDIEFILTHLASAILGNEQEEIRREV